MKQRCLGRTHVLLCCLTITRCRYNFMGDNKLLSKFVIIYVTSEIMHAIVKHVS